MLIHAAIAERAYGATPLRHYTCRLQLRARVYAPRYAAYVDVYVDDATQRMLMMLDAAAAVTLRHAVTHAAVVDAAADYCRR